MTMLNYATTRYYRHSGRVPARGLLLALLAGVGLSLPLGAVYAYIDLYNPLIYVAVLATLGAGGLLGWVLGKVLVAGKVRNTPVAVILALLSAGALYLFTWNFYLYAVTQRFGLGDTGLFDPLLHPQGAWALIQAINAQGVWNLKGDSPINGIALTIIWAVEAGMLVVIPTWLARKAVAGMAFCEQCDKWCTQREIINLKAGDKKAMRTSLEGKDFAALASLPRCIGAQGTYWNVYFQGCADCDTTQTLCVDEVTITTNSKGRDQVKKRPIVARLVLSPEDTVAVATVAAGMKAPPLNAPPAAGPGQMDHGPSSSRPA